MSSYEQSPSPMVMPPALPVRPLQYFDEADVGWEGATRLTLAFDLVPA